MSIYELSIEEIFPYIFNRQYFFVYPNEKVYTSCICLIPAIEVYIDGIIVLEDKKPIGRIGSKHILEAYYRLGRASLYMDAKDIMLATSSYVTNQSYLKDILDDMKRHRLGFVPVVNSDIIAVVSIYDLLRLIAKRSVDEQVIDVASRLITIDANSSIRDTLRIMLENNIRRVFFRDDDIYTIVGRDILDFIISNEVIENKPIDIDKIKVSALKKRKSSRIDKSASVSDAAVALLKEKAPSSLLIDDEYIVTPWDIVMKVKYK